MAMERDVEYLRDLLVHFRNDFNPGSDMTPYDGKEDYHMYLLNESRLIEAKVQKFKGGQPPLYANVHVTSAGHDFLDAAENDTVWSKTKEELKEKGMRITNVPMDVLISFVKAKFNETFGV